MFGPQSKDPAPQLYTDHLTQNLVLTVLLTLSDHSSEESLGSGSV